jgi:hypothetical protein
MRKAKRLLQLERIKKMRQKLARKRLMDDSLETLRKIREERVEVRSSGG